MELQQRLLGLILRKVSKRPIEEFAKEALLEPLGIQDEVWGRFAKRRRGDVKRIAVAAARFG